MDVPGLPIWESAVSNYKTAGDMGTLGNAEQVNGDAFHLINPHEKGRKICLDILPDYRITPVEDIV